MALQVCGTNGDLHCSMDGALPRVVAPDCVGTTDQGQPSKPVQTVCTTKIVILFNICLFNLQSLG
jgi:hypothetical protein